MTDEKIDEVLKPALSVCKTLYYSDGVIIGSVLGQLVSEIKRLRTLCREDDDNGQKG